MENTREIVKGLADFAFSASHANGSALNTRFSLTQICIEASM